MAGRTIARTRIRIEDARPPTEVQAALERATRSVFAIGPDDDDATRSTRFVIGGVRYRMRLRFLGGSGDGWLYDIDVEADTDVPATDPAAEMRTVEAWVGLWTDGLERSAADVDATVDARGAAQMAAWRDAEAALADPARVQRTILAALRDAGREIATAHKEGGTIFRFDGRRFVRIDYGESNATRRFAGDAAFLAHLRRFFDGELARPTNTERIAEADAWRLILRRIEPSATPGRRGAHVVHRAGAARRWRAVAVVAVFVLAAVLAVVKWHPRAEALRASEPVPRERVRDVGTGRPTATDLDKVREDHRRAVEAARSSPAR